MPRMSAASARSFLRWMEHELDGRGPAMLQSNVSDLSSVLARRLCQLAGGRVQKALFACSGSEGVRTGRIGMLTWMR